jgi:hypothetical protein
MPLLAASSHAGLRLPPATCLPTHVHHVPNSSVLHRQGRLYHPSPCAAGCSSRQGTRCSAAASDSPIEAAAVPSSSTTQEQDPAQHLDAASPLTSGQTVDVPGVSREVVAQKTMAAVKAFSSSKRKVRHVSAFTRNGFFPLGFAPLTRYMGAAPMPCAWGACLPLQPCVYVRACTARCPAAAVNYRHCIEGQVLQVQGGGNAGRPHLTHPGRPAAAHVAACMHTPLHACRCGTAAHALRACMPVCPCHVACRSAPLGCWSTRSKAHP